MRVTKSEFLTSQKWLNLVKATYDHHGESGTWIFASRRSDPKPGAWASDAIGVVAIVPGPDGARLSVVCETRVPTNGPVYALPAGLLERGERPEEAASRELLEETGLKFTRVLRVSPPLYSSPGMTDEQVQLVFVEARDDGEGQALDGHEEIRAELWDLTRIRAYLAHPDLPCDARLYPILVLCDILGAVALGS
jgi:ADP-ribose pyrophosphatase